MGIATTGSVTGSLFGIVCLALFTPLLGEVALSFGAFEFFWLAVFGVMMSGQVTGEDALKGWIMGFLGLFVALVGQDGIHAHNRFTFGIADLGGGFSLIPVLVGAFGFAEVLTAMKDQVGAGRGARLRLGPAAHRRRDALLEDGAALRASSASMSGFCRASARTWRRGRPMPRRGARARRREKFGKGSVEGLMAAETGDNASIPGAIIPALALAIPGSAPAAVLLAAMIIHGVRPGPLLMVE